jgi:hypothetical protein
MRQVALREFCACRAGDKGDISDVTIFASRPEFFAVLQAELTTERVLQFMAPIGPERIERFEVANLEAVKFVLYGALGGGRCRYPTSCFRSFPTRARPTSRSGNSRRPGSGSRGASLCRCIKRRTTFSCRRPVPVA